jgi:hypothetical protein
MAWENPVALADCMAQFFGYQADGKRRDYAARRTEPPAVAKRWRVAAFSARLAMRWLRSHLSCGAVDGVAMFRGCLRNGGAMLFLVMRIGNRQIR